MTTPKTLSDLRNETTIRTTSHFETVTQAGKYFADLFDVHEGVKINHLFDEEVEGDGGVRVYECYADSGSVDYLYIIERL